MDLFEVLATVVVAELVSVERRRLSARGGGSGLWDAAVDGLAGCSVRVRHGSIMWQGTVLFRNLSAPNWTHRELRGGWTGLEEGLAHALHHRHLQALCHLQQCHNVVRVQVQARRVHVVEQLPDPTDVLNDQVKDITLLRLEQGPEEGAERCQDVFVGFKTDSFNNESAVTQQPLDPLLLQLLQQEPAVRMHVHHRRPTMRKLAPAAEPGPGPDPDQTRTAHGPHKDPGLT